MLCDWFVMICCLVIFVVLLWLLMWLLWWFSRCVVRNVRLFVVLMLMCLWGSGLSSVLVNCFRMMVIRLFWLMWVRVCCWIVVGNWFRILSLVFFSCVFISWCICCWCFGLVIRIRCCNCLIWLIWLLCCSCWIVMN